LPRRFGIGGALVIARGLHLAMLACLVMLAVQFHIGLVSWLGVALVALLLAYEHSLVKPNDLSHVDAAFFTVNGYVSMLFFLFWGADIFLIRRGGDNGDFCRGRLSEAGARKGACR
jgi:4-hydroxybenzoate polyprenyltransferase